MTDRPPYLIDLGPWLATLAELQAAYRRLAAAEPRVDLDALNALIARATNRLH